MNMVALRRSFVLLPTGKFTDLLAALPFAVYCVIGLSANISKLGHDLHDIVTKPGQALPIIGLLSTIAVSLLVGLMLWMVVTRRPPVAKTQGLFPRIAALLGTYLCVAFVLLPHQPTDWRQELAGLLLVIGGEAIAFYSLFWLGRSFSLMPEARHLVTGGPYALVRHPLYLGEQTAAFGILLQLWSPLAASIYILQFAFQFVRMGNEERILRETYPEYEAYGAKTARLLPGIY